VTEENLHASRIFLKRNIFVTPYYYPFSAVYGSLDEAPVNVRPWMKLQKSRYVFTQVVNVLIKKKNHCHEFVISKLRIVLFRLHLAKLFGHLA
jgi:hypothetical protein